MDWTPIVQATASLLAAVLSLLGVKAWALLEEKIKGAALARLSAAVERAAGTVIEAMSDPRLGPAVEAAKQAAIDTATLAVRNTMHTTIAKLNGNPTQIRNMVVGEVGKLLAKAPQP